MCVCVCVYPPWGRQSTLGNTVLQPGKLLEKRWYCTFYTLKYLPSIHGQTDDLDRQQPFRQMDCKALYKARLIYWLNPGMTNSSSSLGI